MASRWPAVGVSLRRSSLQNQERLEESEALQPVASHPDTSSGALGSLCRQFQRRLPLRAVSLNLGVGPSWKRLETPEPGQQGLQAAARSAKSTLGAMSQKIQESCQSGTKWLVETQVKARRRKRGAQKGSSPPARSLSQRSTRLSVAAPALSTLDPWEKEYHHLSAQMGPHAHPWRRSRREAAFRSPYSSAERLCSPSESDSDLEPVGAGIRHLQKVSQELDEAIVAEDRHIWRHVKELSLCWKKMQSGWALQSRKHANPLICWEPGLWLSPSLMEHTWGAPPIATTTFQNLIWGGSLWCSHFPWGVKELCLAGSKPWLTTMPSHPGSTPPGSSWRTQELVVPLSCHKQGRDSQGSRRGLLGGLCSPASATSRPARDHRSQPASNSGRSRRGGGNHPFYFPLGLRNSTHI